MGFAAILTTAAARCSRHSGTSFHLCFARRVGKRNTGDWRADRRETCAQSSAYATTPADERKGCAASQRGREERRSIHLQSAPHRNFFSPRCGTASGSSFLFCASSSSLPTTPRLEGSLRFASGAFSFPVLLFAQINVSGGISAGVVG